jgi:hypothetical protein
VIGTPYLALGAAGAIIAAAFGGYFHGKHVAAGEASEHELTQLTIALEQKHQAELRIAELEKAAAGREIIRQNTVREIYRAIPQIIHDPVYRSVCIADDGVRLLDRAQAAAGGHSGADPAAPAGQAGRAAGDPAQRGSGDGKGDDRR